MRASSPRQRTCAWDSTSRVMRPCASCDCLCVRSPASRGVARSLGHGFVVAPGGSFLGHCHDVLVRSRVPLTTVTRNRSKSRLPALYALHANSHASATRLTDSSLDAGEVVPGPQYVPLHVHSDFSLLDGASHLPDLVARATELGVPALALTDHGVLYGAVALVKQCAASDTPVKPIIGNEMYVANVDTPYSPEAEAPSSSQQGSHAASSAWNESGSVAGAGAVASQEAPSDSASPKKKGKRKSGPRKYHLIVLAKNATGYRNLVKLTTHAHLHGKVGTGIFARPCVNKALLFQHREGLIVSSGCLGGEVAQAILHDRPDVARDVARWYKDVYGDDYYLEIQDHGSPEDRKVNVEVVKIGKELGISVIVTNDSHFTSCLDAEAHDALICIQTGKLLTDENRLRYAGNEFFKSADEMRMCFVDHLDGSDVEAALHCTLEVAKKVETYDLFGETRIPDFPVPALRPEQSCSPPYIEGDHASYLRFVARHGMADRLRARRASGLLDRSGTAGNLEKVYSDRLEFELDMIAQMGFASYFLVVWDYVLYARDEGIPVGPGRGSAAGSLVAFSLRITDVDPIQYNLLFERFLNPERRSMPDIDTDFSVEGREKIIQYVTEKYGPDRVAQIITFNRLTSKAVLKDVARVHSVPYAEADKLAKLIPVSRGKPATLSEMMGDGSPSKEFKDIVKRNPGYRVWLEKARRIEGTNKTFGIHAAGVVISAEPLTDVVPLSRAKHGETITQYPMEDVEALGLLKMDFLGLKNLSVIETAVNFIATLRRRRREFPSTDFTEGGESSMVPDGLAEDDLDFSVDSLPLDDAKTYEFLANGELDGIFQLDASAGMRSIVRELRPSSLEDISAILALYRPGPLDAGLIPKFINRKHGKEAIEYDHRLLEPILKETYGIMVYQEQIMRIARDLAGYSLGQADILRRAMGKKKKADMAREQPRFVEGASERGVAPHIAEKLFETMTLFAEYCFNKSHSTAYAYLTYQTAYLKANHPVEYAAALLRANANQSDKLVRYLADARVSGVEILPPSVNRSELEFSVDIVGLRGDKTGIARGGRCSVVRFGLAAVKTVGESVGRALIEERDARGPFSSIIDVIERLDSRVLNKRSMGALVMCGAFDELHPNRRVLHDQLEILLSLHRKVRDRRKRRQKKELTADEEQAAMERDVSDWEAVQLDLKEKSKKCSDFAALDKLAAEKATLGFYASGHPLREMDAQVRSMLTSASVASIVGESSQPLGSEDADALGGTHVEASGRSEVGDGTEVMTLSLITDLKRMTTAKGQKMAKWFMEDTSARVPAIVFPSSFPICEAVVSNSKIDRRGSPDSSTEDSQDENTRSLVVEEDARVVVFGKVVRESSGSSQVVVDDVQRIEDLKVFVATVTLQRDLGHELLMENLLNRVEYVKYSARNLIDPTAVFRVEDSSPYSRRTGDGSESRTRRRSRKVVLDQKARIPLIIKYPGKDGVTDVYSYAGHDCRFQTVTEREISVLAEKTKCRFELVYVKDLLTGALKTSKVSLDRSDKDFGRVALESHTDESDVPRGLSVSYNTTSASESDRAESEMGSAGSATVEKSLHDAAPEVAAMSRVGADISALEERVSSANVTGNPEEPECNAAGSTSIMSGGQDQDLHFRQPLAAQPEGPDTVGVQAGSGCKDSPNSCSTDVIRADVLERAPESSMLLSKLHARRARRRSSVETPPSSEGLFPESIPSPSARASCWSPADAACLSRSENVPSSSGEDGVAGTVAAYAGTTETESIHPGFSSAGKSAEDSGTGLATGLRLGAAQEKSSAMASAQSHSQVFTAVNQIPADSSAIDATCPEELVKAGDLNADSEPVRVSGRQVKNSEEDLDQLRLRTAEEVLRIADTTSSSASPTSGVDSATCRVEKKGISLSSECPLGSLVDAMCFVGGEVSLKYVEKECVLTAIGSADLSKLTHEEQTVDVAGCVAGTRGGSVHVLVRVRESLPSGGRKRARALASTVLTFRAADGSSLAKIYQPKGAQAKKDTVAVEKLLEERTSLESKDDGCSNGSVDESRSRSLMYEMRACGIAEPSSMRDGGNTLLWMSRAAAKGLSDSAESRNVRNVLTCMSHARCEIFDWCSKPERFVMAVDVAGGAHGRVHVKFHTHVAQDQTIQTDPSASVEVASATFGFSRARFVESSNLSA